MSGDIPNWQTSERLIETTLESTLGFKARCPRCSSLDVWIRNDDDLSLTIEDLSKITPSKIEWAENFEPCVYELEYECQVCGHKWIITINFPTFEKQGIRFVMRKPL